MASTTKSSKTLPAVSAQPSVRGVVHLLTQTETDSQDFREAAVMISLLLEALIFEAPAGSALALAFGKVEDVIEKGNVFPNKKRAKALFKNLVCRAEVTRQKNILVSSGFFE